MIELDCFIRDVKTVIHRDISSNPEQMDIVTSDFGRCLKVVAGPGSGKTTVIVLRLLKMIYVDDVPPTAIIATTFTRKAASELKSRILEWGLKLQLHYKEDQEIDSALRERIARLNFNLVVTGTLDSIAEEIMTRYRKPDENPPVVINEFVSRQILLNEYFKFLKKKEDVISELKSLGFGNYDTGNTTKILSLLMDINSRAAENFIDVSLLADRIPLISAILKGYHNTMGERMFMDFPELESRFKERIEEGRMNEFLSGIRVLMVDEYQDTNLQQECIYKLLASKIVAAGGSMIVVGDDDQSIFRFRGSRVHLFADLEERFSDTPVRFETAFLAINYRSSPAIIDICNRLITTDADYQDVRVRGKPSMSIGRQDGNEMPILGIFRETPEQLAHDIACMVDAYVRDGFYRFVCTDGSEYLLERDNKGSAADFVLLMNSTKNVVVNYGKESIKLPLLISRDLNSIGSDISVFNPRGNDLYNDPKIMVLCGLVIKCIDSDFAIGGTLHLTKNQRNTLESWIAAAESYIEVVPDFNGHSLKDVLESWRTGNPYPKGEKWGKKDVRLIDLMSNIITWMPELRNDAESLVYYQALCDAVSNSVLIKGYEFNISFRDGSHKPTEQSVKNIYNKILIPIADGTMDIDEELFFSVSLKDRLSIMTIHQSKGLEFPITIVDVSSDMKTDSGKNRRYPDDVDRTSIIERLMRTHSEQIPQDRGLLDSQFDDVIRKFFVAYSRAQDVLIIVGLNRTLKPGNPLKHMALGWNRHDNWVWRGLPDIKMMR